MSVRKGMVPAAMLAAALVMTTGGCATIFTGGKPDQKVSFKSIPDGATVIVDGDIKGKTPLNLPLARDLNHKVRLELAGYPPFEKDIKTGFNGWVIGNVFLGGIIGLVIDIVSGATDSLNPSTVKVNFQEEKDALKSTSAVTPAAKPKVVTPPPAVVKPKTVTTPAAVKPKTN